MVQPGTRRIKSQENYFKRDSKMGERVNVVITEKIT
jgi:hypothetical protein